MPSNRDRAWLWLAAGSIAIVLLAAFFQIGAGSYEMTWREAAGALLDPAVWRHPATLGQLISGAPASVIDPLPTTTLIVWTVRLPRVLTAILVGINLSLSGCIFQAITRNELASPYLLGVSSGAGLAVMLVLVLVPALTPALPLLAMLGGAAAFLLVYAIAWNRGTSPVRLVLAGVIVAAVAGSLQTALFFLAKDIHVMQNALAWTTGSLTGTGWAQVRLITPWTIFSAVLALAGARQLDILMLGDAAARSLGMRVERTRFLLAAAAIMAAGSSVAVAGLVGFVGLIVPHVVRSLLGSLHRSVLLGCLFAGPALLTSADVVARLALSPVQLPVGIVTGCLGGTFFLFLMRRRQSLHKM